MDFACAISQKESLYRVTLNYFFKIPTDGYEKKYSIGQGNPAPSKSYIPIIGQA
jgi:hypothetical protein